MSSLNTLKARLAYSGGPPRARMENDKLKTLKKAILYSYQSATITLLDRKSFKFNKTFKCLINPDKLKNDYDNKILAIPYESYQVGEEQTSNTLEGEVPTEIQAGDVFYWKETDSYWIVYLQYKEETAYFRGEIRRCDKEVEINKKTYKIFFRGPVETAINWNLKKSITYNELNYSGVIYITKDENTLDYFHRFSKIKIDQKPWLTKVANTSSGAGVIELQIKEDYSNELEDKRLEKEESYQEPIFDKELPHIEGKTRLYPFDIAEYKIVNVTGGIWKISNNNAKIVEIYDDKITLEVTAGKASSFDLQYIVGEEGAQISLSIQIMPL